MAVRNLIVPTPLAAVTCAIAALAVVAFSFSGGGFDGFGTPRAAVPSAAPPVVRAALSDQLDTLALSAGIMPEQMPAWRSFAGAILQLEQATQAFETKVTSGNAGDEDRERAMHALLLGAALSEIDRSLSPQQAGIVRRAMDALVPGMICRGLANG